MDMQKQIQEGMVPYFTHKSWRVRREALTFYYLWNDNLVQSMEETQASLEIALKMLEDKNSKVEMTASNLLSSVINNAPKIIPNLVKIHKSEGARIFNIIKNDKPDSDEAKKLSIKLKVHANVILGESW